MSTMTAEMTARVREFSLSTVAAFQAWQQQGGEVPCWELELEDPDGGNNYEVDSLTLAVSDDLTSIKASIKVGTKSKDGEDTDYLNLMELEYDYDTFQSEQDLMREVDYVLANRSDALADLVDRVDIFDALVTLIASAMGVDDDDVELALSLDIDTTVTDSTVRGDIFCSYRDWLDDKIEDVLIPFMSTEDIIYAYESFVTSDFITERLVPYVAG